MYAKVVVLTHQPPTVDSYTYTVPENLAPILKTGQLVTVPFGKRNPQGVIVEISNDKPEINYRLKNIGGIFMEDPILLPYQIELLSWLSEYYLAPKIDCLKAILPDIPKNPVDISFSKKALHQNLILVPTVNSIPQTMALFPKASSPIVFHNEQKRDEKFKAWLKVKSGNADYIFGSRNTVLLPFANLKRIIIFSEHDPSFKDERSPYFDTLTVARKISQLTKSNLEIFDSSPRISTYFNFQDKVKIPTFKNPPKVKTVSLLQEKLSGNSTFVTSQLESEIEEALENKQSTLLFLNKIKESGTIFCRNCQYKESSQKKPELCPNCQSPDIFFGSLNIHSLKKTIEKLFAKSNVQLISKSDKDNFLKSDIDIATASVFYKLLKKKYSLVCAVSADSLLNSTDINAAQDAYTQITSLKRLAKNILLLQTFSPENKTLQYASDSNYKDFYNEQIKQKKELSYPPFGLLIKIVFSGKNKKTILDKANEFKNNFLKNHQDIASVLGPFEPAYAKKTPHLNLVLKIKSPTDQNKKEEILKNLRRSLFGLNVHAIAKQVIVDPQSIN